MASTESQFHIAMLAQEFTGQHVPDQAGPDMGAGGTRPRNLKNIVEKMQITLVCYRDGHP